MKYGDYFLIESALMVETKFTRKQTRKFKNRRWCKKYKKKYSYTSPRTDIMLIESLKHAVCHPSVAHRIKHLFRNTPNYKSLFEYQEPQCWTAEKSSASKMTFRPLWGMTLNPKPPIYAMNCTA